MPHARHVQEHLRDRVFSPAEHWRDANRLTAGLAALLGQPATRQRIAEAGRATVESLGGALERTLQLLDPYLMQLQLQQRSEHA